MQFPIIMIQKLRERNLICKFSFRDFEKIVILNNLRKKTVEVVLERIETVHKINSSKYRIASSGIEKGWSIMHKKREYGPPREKKA